MGIVGDTSDNIPGVKGIGDKGASTLIKEYKNLETIYSNLENIKNPSLKVKLIQSKEMAFLSRDLATLKTDLKIEQSWEDLKNPNLTQEKIDTFKERGYNVIHKDLSKEIGGSAVKEKIESNKSSSDSVQSPKGNYVRIRSQKELKELVKKLLTTNKFRNRKYLDGKKVNCVLNKYFNEDVYNPEIWKWLSLEIWFNQNIDNKLS
jgi:DNA polymerase-1